MGWIWALLPLWSLNISFAAASYRYSFVIQSHLSEVSTNSAGITWGGRGGLMTTPTSAWSHPGVHFPSVSQVFRVESDHRGRCTLLHPPLLCWAVWLLGYGCKMEKRWAVGTSDPSSDRHHPPCPHFGVHAAGGAQSCWWCKGRAGYPSKHHLSTPTPWALHRFLGPKSQGVLGSVYPGGGVFSGLLPSAEEFMRVFISCYRTEGSLFIPFW